MFVPQPWREEGYKEVYKKEVVVMPSYERILVAVDGSPNSEVAFFRGIELSKEYHAELLIVYITEDTSSSAPFDAGTVHFELDREKGFCGSLLNHYESIARKHGLRHVKTVSNSGSPKTEILSFASMHAADLIICGATGLNTMERILVGSVSQYIMRHANCDVLIARNSNSIQSSGLSIRSASQR